MATQSLLQYLAVALPAIPIQGVAPSRNTTNPRYSSGDITQIASWPVFNYAAIIQRYGPTLNTKFDPTPSPFRLLQSETNLIFIFVSRNQFYQARAGFEHLAPELPARQLSVMTFDGGSAAAHIDQFKPDTAYVVTGGSYATSQNRGSGDLKVSWKWSSSMRLSPVLVELNEYKQVLAQVNFYMGQHGTRYGFILTNTEFVAVKRLDRNGRLAVAAAIP